MVTGGARGIGLATARRLAQSGAHVVVADLDGRRAEAASADLVAAGYQATAVAVDVTNHGSVAAMLDKVTPGAIETELVARMHSAQTRRVHKRGIPLNRYGTPEEVASAAVFLASREAAYITGHVLTVDGGFVAAGIMHRD